MNYELSTINYPTILSHSTMIYELSSINYPAKISPPKQRYIQRSSHQLMPVRYSVHARVDPRDPLAPRRFYPIARCSGETSLRQISKRIASMSTVNSGDVLAVLDLLVQVMEEELSDGRLVRLGDLGTFRLNLQCSGAATEQEVNNTHVQKARLRFKPGEQLAAALLTLSYEKIRSRPLK